MYLLDEEICEYPIDEWHEPVDAKELFEAVMNGAWMDYGFTPKYMEAVIYHSGDLRAARVSKRLVKRWCENVCEFGLNYNKEFHKGQS